MATDPATAAARLSPTASPSRSKFGLLRPITRDHASGFTRGTGDDLLASRVGQVLGSAGELPWRPELQSGLDRLRNVRNDTALSEFARAYVGQALARFIPQIVSVAVEATRDARNLTLRVTCARVSDLDKPNPPTFAATTTFPA